MNGVPEPGMIVHVPMPGVDHGKFYVIVGITADAMCVCATVINSQVNAFILSRPQLLKRQIPISEQNYTFLKHRSFINCAQPVKYNAHVFRSGEYKCVSRLTKCDLVRITENVIASGELSLFDINRFFPTEKSKV